MTEKVKDRRRTAVALLLARLKQVCAFRGSTLLLGQARVRVVQ